MFGKLTTRSRDRAPPASPGTGSERRSWDRLTRRLLAGVLALLAGLNALVGPVAAHSGTTHAGTPHWVLLALFAGGVLAIAATTFASRRGAVSTRTAALSLAAGAVAAVFGGIGLVELQVVGRTPPQLVEIYPLLSLLIAALLAVGGFLAVLFTRPEKPQYALLSLVLAAWIGYPAVMPNGGYYNPIGYLVALSLPALLAYIVWTDARAVLQSVRARRKPKLAGLGAGTLMSVFFAFSAGTMSFNPDQGVNMPTEAFVVPYRVASPLVVWPAIEWYVPSIPFTGYLSVGSVLLMAILGGLVGLNVAVVTQQWMAATEFAGKQLLTGSLAASGATACCCCAPAFYGILSVLFGAAATPVYWSFMVPSSPVGGVFFAASVLLLLRSLIQTTGGSRRRTAADSADSNG